MCKCQKADTHADSPLEQKWLRNTQLKFVLSLSSDMCRAISVCMHLAHVVFAFTSCCMMLQQQSLTCLLHTEHNLLTTKMYSEDSTKSFQVTAASCVVCWRRVTPANVYPAELKICVCCHQMHVSSRTARAVGRTCITAWGHVYLLRPHHPPLCTV